MADDQTQRVRPCRRDAIASEIALHVVIVVGALRHVLPVPLDDRHLAHTRRGPRPCAPTLIPQNPSLAAYEQLFSRACPFGGSIAQQPRPRGRSTTVRAALTSSTAGLRLQPAAVPGPRTSCSRVYLATMMIPLQVLDRAAVRRAARPSASSTPTSARCCRRFASAFGIFLLRQAINQVPRELDEAATLDGAGHFRIFWSVILPNIRPALATLTVFAFMGSWNSFLWPLVVLRKPELQTLPVALAGLQGQYTTQWDIVMAGSVVSILPMLAIYSSPSGTSSRASQARGIK